MTTRELLNSDWSYFPEDGRYGLLSVAGWNTGAQNSNPGITFSIVDLANCSSVVKSRRAGRHTLRRVRDALCLEVDVLNDVDASFEAVSR